MHLGYHKTRMRQIKVCLNMHNQLQNTYLCPKVCAVTAGCMEYVPGNVKKMDQTQIVYTTFVNTLVSETTCIKQRQTPKAYLSNTGNIYIRSANIISTTVDWLQSSHLF